MSARVEKGKRWFKFVLMLVAVGASVKGCFALGYPDAGNKLAQAFLQFIGGAIFFAGPAFVLGWLAGKEEPKPDGSTTAITAGGANSVAPTMPVEATRAEVQQSSTPPTAMPISVPQQGTTAAVNLDDEFWARALAEYESNARRPGLYARVFSQAQGNEAVAKASYLKHRVEEFSLEHQQRVRAQEQAEREAIEKARLSRLTEEQHAYDLLPKGNCPGCETVIPLSASECPKCRALFGPGSAWTVLPLKDV